MDDVTRYLGLREHFAETGDRSLVAECDSWLARHGITVPLAAPVEETAVPSMERAVRKVKQ